MKALKLTESLINSIESPLKGQQIVRDSELHGLGVRVTPTCKSFVVECNRNGKRRRITLGRCGKIDLAQARKKAYVLLYPGPITLQDALDGFLAVRPLKDCTKLSYRRAVEISLHDWLQLPINSITRDMVEERHRSLIGPTRCKTDGKSRANKPFEVLRGVLDWAADKNQLVNFSNPVQRLTANRQWCKLPPRHGVIPDQRLSEFYSAVMKEPKFARDFILFLLLTALRRTEATCLKWTDIDFQNLTLTIPGAFNKSNRDHVLPLTEITAAILESRKNDSQYVFPGRFQGHLKEPRASIDRLRKTMGWNWILHDLRRTALSAGEKCGLPFLVLQRIANHCLERKVTDRYLVLDAPYLRPFMDTLTERLLSLMQTSASQWKTEDRAAVTRRSSKSSDVQMQDAELVPEEDEPVEEEFYF